MSEPTPADGSEQGLSPLAALTSTFSRPGDTFSRLLRKPTWWLPFVLWVAVGFAAVAIITPKIDMEGSIREAMEKRLSASGRTVSNEMVQQQMAVMNRFGWVISASAIVVSAVSFFAVGLILLGGAKAFGATVTYPQVLSLWGHASLPKVFAGLLTVPLFLSQPDGSMSKRAAQTFVKSNVAAFLPAETSEAVVALAASFDVFTLATIGLLVVGFRRIPGWSAASATAVPVVLWLVWVLGKTGWAAVFS